MIEITLPEESTQIKINGNVFELQLTEVEVVMKASKFLATMTKYDTINPENGDVEKVIAERSEEIIRDCDEAGALIDEILGSGALYKLARGRHIRLPLMIKWLGVIVRAVADNFALDAASDE